MRRRDLLALGLRGDATIKSAQQAVAAAARSGVKKRALRDGVVRVRDAPDRFLDDPIWGALAQALIDREAARDAYAPRAEPAPYAQWGDDADDASRAQMANACTLPIAVRGALMADAHLGYGLPIGGVLATRNAVIPYAVGVDIACRMKLTVLDLPPTAITGQRDRLAKTLERETRFGIGARFQTPQTHDVMDDPAWQSDPLLRRLKDRAWRQLGTSGSGNHFVEFGLLTHEPIADDDRSDNRDTAGDDAIGDDPAARDDDLGLERGRVYLALLSHSGSRGAGANVASHYSKRAMEQHPELPKVLRHLAWLDLDSDDGAAYWQAMTLMGRYAEANHACIHRAIARALGADVLLDVENHHNFAWREHHDGEDVIVHRKGATPAGAGVLGVIPGSMASPAFIVRGRGREAALRSASHGAGRVMSRRKANESFTWSQARALLAERQVELLSAGLDEVPMAYRDIESVMAAQRDLVTPLMRFQPRIVKMAPAGERPED
ncbi:MAG: RtcB family protein [Acidobacteriota bacterium]